MPKRTAKKLCQLQAQAFEMFREGKTKGAIASQLGVSIRTIQRWRNTPEDSPQNLQDALSALDEIKLQNTPSEKPVLKPEVETSPQVLFDDDYRKILKLFSGTLDGLQSLLNDSNLSPRDRVSCFKIILDLRRDVAVFCSSPQQEQNSNLSDFELIKKTLRQHILSGASPQGAIALLKLLQAEENLPEHILPNQEKADHKIMLAEIENMTREEKIRLYREYTIKSALQKKGKD